MEWGYAFSVVALSLFLLYWLLSAIESFISYWTVKPTEDKSFAQLLAAEKAMHSIALPALVALATGLLISLSASFFYAEFTEAHQGPISIGAVLFFGAVIVFFAFFMPILKRQAAYHELTKHPETILLAAKDVSTSEPDAKVQIHRLQERLTAWSETSGTSSMGWGKTTRRLDLNKALETTATPKRLRLSWKEAHRVVWKGRVFSASAKVAPWWFWWPVGVITILGGASLFFGIRAAPQAPWVAGGVIALSLIFAFIHRLCLLMVGVRKFSMNALFFEECQSLLTDLKNKTNSEPDLNKLINSVMKKSKDSENRVKQLQAMTVVTSLTTLAFAFAVKFGVRREP